MAHPSQLLMLEAMEGKEFCVCKLTELVGADQSTVSKHLAVPNTTAPLGHGSRGTQEGS